MAFLASVSFAQTCVNPPYFVPRYSFSVTFFRGVEGFFYIQARDNDAAQSVEVITTLLPPSGSFFKDNTLSSAGNNPIYYLFRWTPPLDSTGMTACFQARDSTGIKNVEGNYCVDMVIGNSNLIFFTGVIRDFKKAKSVDFGRSTATADNTFVWVGQYLGNDGKPVFITTNGVPTSTNSTRFAQWFNDVPGINYPFTYTLTLSNVTTADGRIYTFSTSEFYPLDGQNWPGETPAITAESMTHNYFFTYEVHAFFEYNGGEILNFVSSDDMWVFINGRLPQFWSLGGIHPKKTHRVTLNATTAAYHGLTTVCYLTHLIFDSFFYFFTPTSPHLSHAISNSCSLYVWLLACRPRQSIRSRFFLPIATEAPTSVCPAILVDLL